MLPFTGYAGADFARVFARVVMRRRGGPGLPDEDEPVQRGWRMFLSAPLRP